MKDLLASIVSSLKRKESNLSFFEQLVDKTWMKVDNDKSVLRQIEFQRNHVLLDSAHGEVVRKSWELTGAGKIIIKEVEKERIFSATITNGVQLTIEVQGSKTSPDIYFEEKFLVNSVKEFLKVEFEEMVHTVTNQKTKNLNTPPFESRVQEVEPKLITEEEKKGEAVDSILHVYSKDKMIEHLSKEPISLEKLQSGIKFFLHYGPKEKHKAEIEKQKTEAKSIITRIDCLCKDIERADPTKKSFIRNDIRNLLLSKNAFEQYVFFLEKRT